MKRLHQLLYKKRADWSYFYKELPSEAEDGLYYIEMQLYIDDIPVCTENEALGIQYSVNSMYYILIRATDGMQKRLLYMYLQSGSGDQATYELRPAWCVRTSTKEEEDDQAFYDAASGELLF